MAAEETSLTESVLRRDRWVVIAGLTAITLLAWVYIMAGAGMGMSVWEMTTATLFPHRTSMEMQPQVWSLMRWLVIVLMWWVMMIAMMTPSVAPVILLYARAARRAKANSQLVQAVAPATFAGGYLLAWLGFSAAATAVQWGLEQSGAVCSMMMSSMSAFLSAAILIFAGLYQLSPLKHHCLGSCRAPAQFLSRHWRPGAAGALHMGLEHGLLCIGCCWVLMALLFVGGVMNVIWIAILSLFVLLEKLAPHGPWLARATGIALLAWGTATLMV